VRKIASLSILLLLPLSLWAQATVTVDWLNPRTDTTLFANTTFTFANATRGRDIVVIVNNPTTYSVTWPSAVRWPNLAQPAQSANATDIWQFWRGKGNVIFGEKLNQPTVGPWQLPVQVDAAAPNAITNLTVSSVTSNSVTLTFTARGDRNGNNVLVRATTNDMRYYQSPISGDSVLRPGGGGAGTVVFDNVASFNPATATSHMVSYTMGASSNRVLYASLMWGSANTVSGTPTYAGANCTRILNFEPGNDKRIDIWRLAGAATGANNFVVNWSSTTPPVIALISFSGVDQTTPERAPVTATGFTTSATIDATSASNEIVVNASNIADDVATNGAGQTQRWNLTNYGSGGASSYGATKAGAATVNTFWNNVLTNWSASAWSVRPTSGTPDTIPFALAFLAIGEPAPSDSGTVETITVGGVSTPLSPGTQYWFMMSVADAVGNRSLVSNLTTGTTSSGTAGATVKYTLSTGNDNNSGDSPTTAWLTVGKANNNLSTSIDTVLIGDGTYTDAINPINAGTQSIPIVYKNYLNETPLISGSYGIQLTAADSNVVIDGITVQALVKIADIDAAIRITVKNCTLRGGSNALGGATYETFRMNNTKHCKILSNFLDRQDPDNPPICNLDFIGDGIMLAGSQSERNLIEGNTVTGCSHVAITLPYGPTGVAPKYNVVRNNIARLNHSNFTIARRTLFAGNQSYYNGRLICDRRGSSLQSNNADSSIIRYNLLYDDTTGPGSSGHYGGVALYGVSEFGSDWHIRGVRIYNNTVYAGTDQATSTYAFWSPNWNAVPSNSILRGNIFKNNIFMKGTPHPNENNAPFVLEFDDASVTVAANDALFEANIVRKFSAGDVLMQYYGSNATTQYTLAGAKSAKPSQWLASNIESDPLFVNEMGQGSAKNFNLQSGSPARDVGVGLTTAASAGSASTSLTVVDASYFYDGWQIALEVGDSIKIGTTNPVGVTVINYQTNVMTLNATRTWSSGDPIRLWSYYTSSGWVSVLKGSANDIGAKEF
jgi:hypothetical protein